MPFWSISVIDRSRAITTMGAQVAVYLDKKQICDVNILGLQTNKHYFGSEFTNILYKIKMKWENKSFFKQTQKKTNMQSMDWQLHCYANQMMKEYNYYYQILNQPNGKQLLQNYRQILRIQFLEQTHFASQKTKHARKMEWVIGIVNALSHMEMKNYM